MNTLTVNEEGFVLINGELDLTQTSNNVRTYIDAANEGFAAMEEFCQRVEAGQVRSQATYAKFNRILHLAGWRVAAETE